MSLVILTFEPVLFAPQRLSNKIRPETNMAPICGDYKLYSTSNETQDSISTDLASVLGLGAMILHLQDMQTGARRVRTDS